MQGVAIYFPTQIVFMDYNVYVWIWVAESGTVKGAREPRSVITSINDGEALHLGEHSKHGLQFFPIQVRLREIEEIGAFEIFLALCILITLHSNYVLYFVQIAKHEHWFPWLQTTVIWS